MLKSLLAFATLILLMSGGGRVLAQCIAVTVATGPTIICIGSASTTLSVSGYLGVCTPASYVWQTKSISSSTWSTIPGANFSTYIPNATSYYRCRYTTAGSVVVNADSIYITANPSPAVSVSPKTVAVCTGSSVSLCASANMSVSYQWSLNGTLITAATSACYNASVSGTYVCIVTNSFGCTSRDSSVVTVVSTPPTPFSINGPVCAGDSLKLSGTTILANASFSWTGPNSFTSTLQNPKIPNASALSAGMYQLAVGGAGCAAPSGPGNTTAVITCTDSVWAGVPTMTKSRITRISWR